jgi:hypothetical protein
MMMAGVILGIGIRLHAEDPIALMHRVKGLSVPISWFGLFT